MDITEVQGKSRGVAYVLLFFFGVWGFHRLYAEHTTSGLIMMGAGLLATFGIVLGLPVVLVMLLRMVMLIWVIVDIFLIPSLTPQRYVTYHSQT